MDSPSSTAGLVLSGGGARGAYQVGCFKAFRELELDFPLVAGTSIGALNGALYCLDDVDGAERIWSSIATGDVLDIPGLVSSFVEHLGRAEGAEVSREARGTLRKGARMAAKWGRAFFGAWRAFAGANQEKLGALLDSYLDPRALKKARRELIITITTLAGTHYGSTRDLSARQIREHLQASASIPFVFDPVFSTTRRRLAWDGGANPFNVAANAPVEPLYKRGVRTIVIVWLIPELRALSHQYPDAKLMHIAPKKPLGHFLHFSPRRAAELVERGYEDALRALKR
jgi:NTE family protein